MSEVPSEGQYAVTIEVDCNMAHDWHGYAENVSDEYQRRLKQEQG